MLIGMLVAFAVAVGLLATFIVLHVLPGLLGGSRGMVIGATCAALLPWLAYGVMAVLRLFPTETDRQSIIPASAWFFFLSVTGLVLALIGGYIGLMIRNRPRR